MGSLKCLEEVRYGEISHGLMKIDLKIPSCYYMYLTIYHLWSQVTRIVKLFPYKNIF